MEQAVVFDTTVRMQSHYHDTQKDSDRRGDPSLRELLYTDVTVNHVAEVPDLQPPCGVRGTSAWGGTICLP